jgi:tetratricopeptide (TPR) repeat protein
MKAFLCELILSCTLAVPGAKPIDELTYGTVLFAYYQQDYQQALLDTLIAEAQGRRGDNVTRFDLAKGSFAFSDRMYAYSRETFAVLDQHALSDIDQMRLAFHLAREYHRRGEHSEVAAHIEMIDLGKGFLGREIFHPEVEFMRSEVKLQQGDFAGAQGALDRMDKADPLRAYGLFNLGVAYRAADDLASARTAFTELAALRGDSAEVHDLQQRARLALAFLAREQNNTGDAAEILSALPASGRYRDIALAAYGGLAMDGGDYELAARIWLTLQQQDDWTTSSAQARLGYPLSLEHLASQEMALEQYRRAARGFESRLAKLNTLSDNAENPQWVHGLLLAFSAPQQDDEQLHEFTRRWQQQLEHTGWLEWLATEEVHQVLMQWRDLLGMQDWLDRLPARLDAYAEVSAEQHKRAGRAREMLEDGGLLEKREALRSQLDALEPRLQHLREATPTPRAEWMGMLADQREQQLITRLAGMRELIKAHIGEADQAKWLERIERLQGVVFWQLVDASSVRVRALHKQAAATRRVLADVDERVVRVQSAESRFSAGVQTDFHQVGRRAELISAQVDQALDGRKQILAAEIRRGLQREILEVQEYLLVARIAIARATDQLAHSDVEALR